MFKSHICSNYIFAQITSVQITFCPNYISNIILLKSFLTRTLSLHFYFFFNFRQDIQCFGDDTCYALAFGVPALLMLVATVILVVGDKTVGYTHKAPQGSILTQVFGAIGKNTNSILPKMKSVLPTMKSVLPTMKICFI